MSPERKAEFYHRRAAELEKSIAGLEEEAARNVMSNVAAKYERIASNMETFLANPESPAVYLL